MCLPGPFFLHGGLWFHASRLIDSLGRLPGPVRGGGLRARDRRRIGLRSSLLLPLAWWGRGRGRDVCGIAVVGPDPSRHPRAPRSGIGHRRGGGVRRWGPPWRAPSVFAPRAQSGGSDKRRCCDRARDHRQCAGADRRGNPVRLGSGHPPRDARYGRRGRTGAGYTEAIPLDRNGLVVSSTSSGGCGPASRGPATSSRHPKSWGVRLWRLPVSPRHLLYPVRRRSHTRRCARQSAREGTGRARLCTDTCSSTGRPVYPERRGAGRVVGAVAGGPEPHHRRATGSFCKDGPHASSRGLGAARLSGGNGAIHPAPSTSAAPPAAVARGRSCPGRTHNHRTGLLHVADGGTAIGCAGGDYGDSVHWEHLFSTIGPSVEHARRCGPGATRDTAPDVV